MGRVVSGSCGGDAHTGLGAKRARQWRLAGRSGWPGWSYPRVPWGQVSSLIPAGQGIAAPAADLDSLGVGIETKCLQPRRDDDLQLLKHLSTRQYILCGSEQRYTC